jgi:hypothetical protein
MALAAGTTGAAGLAACSHGAGQDKAQPSSPDRSPSPARTRTAPTGSDWAALDRDLDGRLIRPGDHDYATARLLFDPRFDYIRPAGIASAGTRRTSPRAWRSAAGTRFGWRSGPAGTATQAGQAAPDWSWT